MLRTNIGDIVKHEGDEVELFGWVHGRRDHGKIIFIDLRDRSGLVQVVFTPAIFGATDLRLEYALRLTGKVKVRPASMVNEKQPNGKHEVEAMSLEILNPSKETPIPVDSDGYDINEEVRMKYRYLDLRRERLVKNMIARHKVIKFFRDFLDKEGFLEIETPILTKSTPEGARDYLVPSRIYPGNFYALPQSPQQYKQLLMVAGIEKYFQIARCFRDEDTRGDRQPEFTQLDLEMSFVEREDVLAITERLFIETTQAIFPEKRIQEIPFPRMSYSEAMEKYQSDKPDLRTDKNDPNLLAFCWVLDFPFFERVKDEAHPEPVEGRSGGSTGSPQTSKEVWTFTHNPFSAPKPEYMEDLLAGKNVESILTTQYDLALNGYEVGGGSIRNHRPEALRSVFKIMGFPDERIDANFGHMLEALSYGAPPHGGIAPGIDRFIMILQNEPNIREVIAFPKTGDGRDPMMQSPSGVDKSQLDELGLRVAEKKQ
ncbi:MAG: aspartate--tRNA ligase [Patescibacteria group bacterium]